MTGEEGLFWREMVQMDGSHHAWLEGRGPRLVLMGYVDDAKNNFFGHFYGYEGFYPANGLIRALYKPLRASSQPLFG